MTVPLRLAGNQDLPAIAALMNAAFRGGGGQRGWSTEAGYIAGDRTTEALLAEEIRSGALLLVLADGEGARLQGCVSLKRMSADRWYLGSLAVEPARQNSGFGRSFLEAAESYAAAAGAATIEITVINVRDTLIAWYERRGYCRTGEIRPFPYGDDRFGTPLRDDLSFVVLEKRRSEPEPMANP